MLKKILYFPVLFPVVFCLGNISFNVSNFAFIFKYLDIPKRTLSEAVRLNIKNGKCVSTQINNQRPYKHGWHTTWDNKQVFYRSSYELDYAKELDEQKIEYKMENLRILYWDSQRQIQRVAIPDFYLPKQNKIVEIKSKFTYNEQNMKDKFKFYKEHGYKVKLILEHKEIFIDS